MNKEANKHVMSGRDGVMKNSEVGLGVLVTEDLGDRRWLCGERTEGSEREGNLREEGMVFLDSSLECEPEQNEVNVSGLRDQKVAELGHCSGLKTVTPTSRFKDFCSCLQRSL